MDNTVYKITLDLHSMSAPVSLNVREGETGRKICITLAEDGKPYKIASECYAVFSGTKPDGKILWNGCTIEDDTIIYKMTEQTVNVAGWMPVQIRLYGAGGKLLLSPDFVLLVDAPVVRDDAVVSVSENEVTALTQLVSEVTELLENLGNGSVTDEQIAQAVANYLEENPMEVTGVVKTINGAAPDENGNVAIDIPRNATLTLTGAVNATYDGSTNVRVEIPAPVSDDHINSLISTALGVIENGAY